MEDKEPGYNNNQISKKKLSYVYVLLISLTSGMKIITNTWWQISLEYDDYVVIRDNVYEDEYTCFNKLLMFDRFREEHYRNIYFDIDVIIKGDCNKFTDELTVCDSRSWQQTNTIIILQISSDIISWSGDYSHIHAKVADNIDYYYVKYHNGIDKYLYDEHDLKRHKTGYSSIQTQTDHNESDVVLFNQHYKTMKKAGWWHKYTINHLKTWFSLLLDPTKISNLIFLLKEGYYTMKINNTIGIMQKKKWFYTSDMKNGEYNTTVAKTRSLR